MLKYACFIYIYKYAFLIFTKTYRHIVYVFIEIENAINNTSTIVKSVCLKNNYYYLKSSVFFKKILCFESF